MDLVAGVPAHTCMVCHSRRGRCGGNHGIPTVVAVVVVAVAWLVGLSAPAPVWAGVPARPQVPAAVVVVAAAMWAVTVPTGIVAAATGVAAAVAVVVGFPAAGSALAAVATGAVVGVVAVGEIQGPAVVRVWCYSGGQRLTRRAYWHCFRVGRS